MPEAHCAPLHPLCCDQMRQRDAEWTLRSALADSSSGEQLPVSSALNTSIPTLPYVTVPIIAPTNADCKRRYLQKKRSVL